MCQAWSTSLQKGHDVTRTEKAPDPKSVDQARLTPSGKLTPNGLLERAALAGKSGTIAPELRKDSCGNLGVYGIDNLHYDYDVSYFKGGSSLTAKNIRLLCARHNLAKSNKIE
jgi:hypothetical protein